MDNRFRLVIITPEKVFFDDMAESVSVESPDGRLEVLKGHIPSVISIISGSIRIKQNGEWKEASCSDGFMEVRPEKTIILLETVEWPEQIDLVRAKRDAEIAMERMRQQQSMREYRESKATLARAMARLRVGSRNRVNID